MAKDDYSKAKIPHTVKEGISAMNKKEKIVPNINVKRNTVKIYPSLPGSGGA